ncbi:RNB-domain-containing protein [Gonapodya prolifera JEL478]|uniref:RNB-domain-containing protein n=1 Tax=Gonapodya prolifera (strain JEL478) TaxID=1344416 RepID=A0A139A1A1_GONPJ|nr:RNB-domain-containing protein [Gonapodya prolifera JEL478]|eukprot:KXS10509.1 RNB-domain-containing protein [Gonapodya prolifera JEL478]
MPTFASEASHIVIVDVSGQCRSIFTSISDQCLDQPFSPPDPAAPPIPAGFSHPGSVLAYVPKSAGKDAAWVPLAPGGTPLALLFGVLIQFGLNPLYSNDVRSETTQLLAHPGLDDPSLKDLVDLPFVTIDNEDSRDLDQAMFLARVGPDDLEDQKAGGAFIIKYALSDASYYVRPGTAIFNHALSRGTSFYLPAFTVPMLPHQLSEGLVSLNPNVVRRALCFHLTLDANGKCVRSVIERCKIRSQAKLSYVGVQKFYDGMNPSLAGKPYTETLELLREVGTILIAESESRDVVRYDRINLQVSLDVLPGADLSSAEGHGAVLAKLGMRRELRVDTDRYNEQISLLCNREGAAFFQRDAAKDTQVQPIYRTHSPPPESRLVTVNSFIDTLISVHGLDPKLWMWHHERGESVQAYLARLPGGDDDVTAGDKERRIRDSIERQFLMVNTGSEYSPEPSVHYALGVSAYSRFSSPMREVVGIFTHKEALEKLDRSLAGSDSADEALRAQVISSGMKAKQTQNRIEKAVQELAMNHFFAADARQPWPDRPRRKGTVMGMAGSKVYVTLDDPPMELKVYLDDVGRVTGRRWAVVERFHDDDGVVVKETGQEWKDPKAASEGNGNGKGKERCERTLSPDTGAPEAPQTRQKSRNSSRQREPVSSGVRGKAWWSLFQPSPELEVTGSLHDVALSEIAPGPLRVGDEVTLVTTGYNAPNGQNGASGASSGRWMMVFVKSA